MDKQTKKETPKPIEKKEKTKLDQEKEKVITQDQRNFTIFQSKIKRAEILIPNGYKILKDSLYRIGIDTNNKRINFNSKIGNCKSEEDLRKFAAENYETENNEVDRLIDAYKKAQTIVSSLKKLYIKTRDETLLKIKDENKKKYYKIAIDEVAPAWINTIDDTLSKFPVEKIHFIYNIEINDAGELNTDGKLYQEYDYSILYRNRPSLGWSDRWKKQADESKKRYDEFIEDSLIEHTEFDGNGKKEALDEITYEYRLRHYNGSDLAKLKNPLKSENYFLGSYNQYIRENSDIKDLIFMAKQVKSCLYWRFRNAAIIDKPNENKVIIKQNDNTYFELSKNKIILFDEGNSYDLTDIPLKELNLYTISQKGVKEIKVDTEGNLTIVGRYFNKNYAAKDYKGDIYKDIEIDFSNGSSDLLPLTKGFKFKQISVPDIKKYAGDIEKNIEEAIINAIESTNKPFDLDSNELSQTNTIRKVKEAILKKYETNKPILEITGYSMIDEGSYEEAKDLSLKRAEEFRDNIPDNIKQKYDIRCNGIIYLYDDKEYKIINSRQEYKNAWQLFLKNAPGNFDIRFMKTIRQLKNYLRFLRSKEKINDYNVDLVKSPEVNLKSPENVNPNLNSFKIRFVNQPETIGQKDEND